MLRSSAFSVDEYSIDVNHSRSISYIYIYENGDIYIIIYIYRYLSEEDEAALEDGHPCKSLACRLNPAGKSCANDVYQFCCAPG
jgi:hypothetical protein